MSDHLAKVHEVNLSILKEVDRICRKHQIQYMMDSGTLLGAVRHKGFIPWDDDADLAFTRENYERFVAVVGDELKAGMTFLDYRSFRKGTAFYDYTSRIIYDRSKTHDDTKEMAFYEGKLNHLWVDLFVLDRLPNHKRKEQMTIFLQKIIYGLSMGHRYKLNYKKYGMVHKLFVWCLAFLGKMLPLPWMFLWQERISVKDNKQPGKVWYYSNYQPDYLYVRIKDQWCSETVDLDFCDTKLMAPKGWHDVLTWIYGDYQKMPPEDQQIPTHSSIEIEIYD